MRIHTRIVSKSRLRTICISTSLPLKRGAPGHLLTCVKRCKDDPVGIPKLGLEPTPTWQDERPMEEPVQERRPPLPAQRPTMLTKHGDSRIDPYFWLRQKANPEVIAYLQAENAYADAVMAPVANLQERLYEEIVGRVQQTDTSAPALFKGYWHYIRTVEGLDYEIYCRRKGSMDPPQEIDPPANELAPG